MNQQLSLFKSKRDGGSASLIGSISEHQTQALQRFLEKGKDPIVCVNTYSPGKRIGYVLEADRMPREKLYSYLKYRGYRWKTVDGWGNKYWMKNHQ